MRFHYVDRADYRASRKMLVTALRGCPRIHVEQCVGPNATLEAIAQSMRRGRLQVKLMELRDLAR